ncbi:leucine rich repeat-containing protein [Besnoitia besnoiti]|uniref:Leucine rich repeat-containing protein n=1 Tax=Besnoitia besnoiti TaxID=94643 RepID=A0A2A9MCJ2_BESBE|nr:leucine rich repeat-containing protein [Besnoitia besnoiti]PFH33327.1 leucine rich repeat-containing protein [Besnoitia besnoiti]
MDPKLLWKHGRHRLFCRTNGLEKVHCASNLSAPVSVDADNQLCGAERRSSCSECPASSVSTTSSAGHPFAGNCPPARLAPCPLGSKSSGRLPQGGNPRLSMRLSEKCKSENRGPSDSHASHFPSPLLPLLASSKASSSGHICGRRRAFPAASVSTARAHGVSAGNASAATKPQCLSSLRRPPAVAIEEPPTPFTAAPAALSSSQHATHPSPVLPSAPISSDPRLLALSPTSSSVAAEEGLPALIPADLCACRSSKEDHGSVRARNGCISLSISSPASPSSSTYLLPGGRLADFTGIERPTAFGSVEKQDWLPTVMDADGITGARATAGLCAETNTLRDLACSEHRLRSLSHSLAFAGVSSPPQDPEEDGSESPVSQSRSLHRRLLPGGERAGVSKESGGERRERLHDRSQRKQNAGVQSNNNGKSPDCLLTPSANEKDEPWDEERCLQHIASANDIKGLLHDNRLDEVKALELVMDRPVFVSVFGRFPNLQELILVSQGLATLVGLECCRSLRKLILSENKLTSLEGLASAADLEFLDVSSNRIASLRGHLGSLSRLHTLRIASNRLTTLEGLRLAPNLEDLHAPGNRIDRIGDLRHNLKLQKVNLASNRVSELSEVVRLAALPALVELHMADLDFNVSPNPVCRLKNFEALCIYHLTRLRFGDRTPGSSDSSSERLRIQQAKVLQEALHESLIVNRAVADWMEELKNRAEQSLLWEHESAGNIFAERGTPAHSWYNDVVQLIESRFHLKEFQPLSLTGVRVKAVSKIHNRSLEIRFNEQHDRLLEDGWARSEVLFYGVDPEAPQELHKVCRRGFLSFEEAEKEGIHPFIPLCTSLYAAEAPRLRSFFKREVAGAVAREALRAREEWSLFSGEGCVTAQGMEYVFDNSAMLFPPGELLICRAIIHEPTLSCLMVEDDHVCGPSALWRKKPIRSLAPYAAPAEEEEDPAKEEPSEACPPPACSTASYRYREGQPHDKYWWILSPDMVLPLYHVVIDYENAKTAAPPAGNRQLATGRSAGGVAREPRGSAEHAETRLVRKTSNGRLPAPLDPDPSQAAAGLLSGCTSAAESHRAATSDVPRARTDSSSQAPRAGASDALEEEQETFGEFLQILDFNRRFLCTSGDLPQSCVYAAASAALQLGDEAFAEQGDRGHRQGGVSHAFPGASRTRERSPTGTEDSSSPRQRQKNSRVCCGREAPRAPSLLGRRGVLSEEALWSSENEAIRRMLNVNSDADLRSLTILALPNSGLVAIEPSLLERTLCLKELRLPWNRIKSFEDILQCSGEYEGPPLLPALGLLDVSFNEIKEVSSFVWAPALHTLDLSFNAISEAQSLAVIASRSPSLRDLRIKGNPVGAAPSASETVAAVVPQLARLDEEALRPPARRPPGCEGENWVPLALRSTVALDDLLPFCFLPAPTRETSPRSELELLASPALSIETAFELKQCCGSPEKLASSIRASCATACAEFGLLERGFFQSLSRSNWPERVECIDLSKQRLEALPDVGALANLRRAVLSQNKLASLQPLLACTKLEAVVAFGNRLGDLAELYPLQELRHLDVSENAIREFPETSVAPRKLKFLALENKVIAHVANLEGFDSLTQLFLSSNKLADFRSIVHLATVRDLKVLDVAGNPLCRLPDYRDYTLYLLSGLKILDGIAVNSQHQVQLREAFSGKVTAELLEELLGSAPPYPAESLDLCDRGIRDLGDMIASANFPNLRELRLDGNLLTTLAGVAQLPKLEVLRVNRNRMEIKGSSLGGDASEDTLPFPLLQVLDLSFNCITDIRDLQGYQWRRLTVLHLAGNAICSIEGLEELHALRELDLSHNKLRRCLPGCFQSLKRLERLNLERNGLKSLSNISPLPSLKVLNVSRNRIKEVLEVANLADLSSLRYLSFRGNPAAGLASYRVSILRYLPHLLELDSKAPTSEELGRAELLSLSQMRSELSVPSASAPPATSACRKNKLSLKVVHLDLEPISQHRSPLAAAPGGTK